MGSWTARTISARIDGMTSLSRSVFLFWRDVWAIPKVWRIAVVSILVIVVIVGQPLRDRPKSWLGFLIPAVSFIAVVGTIRFLARKHSA